MTMRRLVSILALRGSLSEGIVWNVLMELRDVIVHEAMIGEAVKLEGLGTFTPSIDLDGTFKMTYRADKWLKGKLNVPYNFLGDIKNKDMIGKTVEDLVARWNEEHPDDLVEEPKKKDKK